MGGALKFFQIMRSLALVVHSYGRRMKGVLGIVLLLFCQSIRGYAYSRTIFLLRQDPNNKPYFDSIRQGLRHDSPKVNIPVCRPWPIASTPSPEDDVGFPTTLSQCSDEELQTIIRFTVLAALIAKDDNDLFNKKRGYTMSQLPFTSQVVAESIRQFDNNLGLYYDHGSKDYGKRLEEIKSFLAITNSVEGLPFRDILQEKYDAIFDTSPTQLYGYESATAAGQAALEAMISGKKRMLIDVSDLELRSNLGTLIQYIDNTTTPLIETLATEPPPSRIKIVFPEVTHLREYKSRTITRASDRVQLCTLSKCSINPERDKLLVLVAPEPESVNELTELRNLILSAANHNNNNGTMEIPILVLNYHSVPVAQLPDGFEKVYHIQYLTISREDIIVERRGPKISQEPNETRSKDDALISELFDDPDVVDNSDGVGGEHDELEAILQRVDQESKRQPITRAILMRVYPK